MLTYAGLKGNTCVPQPWFGISNRRRKALARRNVHNAHNDKWAGFRVGHTKLFVPKSSCAILRSVLDFYSAKVGPFITFLIGHSLNKHTFRLRVTHSPVLEEDEYITHILCECPAIMAARLAAVTFEVMGSSRRRCYPYQRSNSRPNRTNSCTQKVFKCNRLERNTQRCRVCIFRAKGTKTSPNHHSETSGVS